MGQESAAPPAAVLPGQAQQRLLGSTGNRSELGSTSGFHRS